MAILTQEERREKNKEIRILAAEKAYNRGIKEHISNGDELLPKRLMNYTKGLPHNHETGLLQDEADFEKFKDGICSGKLDVIKETPLGPTADFADLDKEDRSRIKYWHSRKGKIVNKLRAWESSGAGLTFTLQGPDAQAVTMPPAPRFGSNELTAELAEVYCQAILRDVPFSSLKHNPKLIGCLEALNHLDYFSTNRRNSKPLTAKNIFRGFTAGDLTGPYISQFLLAGNNGLNTSGKKGKEFKARDGKINFGALVIDQKVRTATQKDYMTDWDEYVDVQNGADFRGLEEYKSSKSKSGRRFITTGRDLATYVHYDALYQAYLNACLILLSEGAPFDKGVPFQGADEVDRQQGFALYGGPHILTLVTKVATTALKAVRFQKFNIHRRLRPEACAARMEKKDAILKALSNESSLSENEAENLQTAERTPSEQLEKMHHDLSDAGIFSLLKSGNKLLPMAFCEGSPMHPSYGAGHATVAGACVTLLKAFFDHEQYINISEAGKRIKFSEEAPRTSRAFVPTTDGASLVAEESVPLTVEGELNKLAANISIGRNWAGVHYYTDYTESMRMGEEIAIGLLEEQAITYNPEENFHLSLRKFNGSLVVIDKDGVHPPIA